MTVYRDALAVDLIDSKVRFRVILRTKTTINKDGKEFQYKDVSEAWSEFLDTEFDYEFHTHIGGDSLVKIAKIFGIDADETDVIGCETRYDRKAKQQKRHLISASAINIPIYSGIAPVHKVNGIKASINGETLDMMIDFDGGTDHITYKGRYYIEWKTDD